MKKNIRLKPFVKWAGGKSQLLDFLKIIINFEYDTYFEPFLGGGSLFLDLLPQKAVLSDINKELIISWQTLKNNTSEVLSLISDYVTKLNQQKKEFYYNLRSQDPFLLNDVQKTARFIFLNKTCFNGLYRVNSKNQFNTPFNGKENINLSNIINESNLKKIITFLKDSKNKISFFYNDYKIIITKAQKNDFIFCDPPYDSDTKTFNSYNIEAFDKKNQKELCEYLQDAHVRGAKWILTNHDTTLINFLYRDFHILKIPVNRFINSQSDNRKNNTYETIITNFKLTQEQKKKIDHLLFVKELKNTSYCLKDYVS
ncbi:MAG: Dam family site-specific DNA-(adenine-N6)-methyltransferase [Candidatus Phytoplasma australasiaticum]|nr:Dam family site-specific DNA-(adenine-N6)-methyltransferase [Candidatus Phytoplasma australasiaticum]MDV3167568.1 Dam family site-specific DNA-(adenine-N6)-methyltransferase [Candidatus Phytoplasma australasiaticum]